MNLIIEIIDGVAYTFDETPNHRLPCNICALRSSKSCYHAKLCGDYCDNHYRRLTAEERTEIIKAMEGDAE